MDKGASSRRTRGALATLAGLCVAHACPACTDYTGDASADASADGGSGTSNFLPPPSSEAGADATATSDAVAPGTCDPDGAFGPAVPFAAFAPPGAGTVNGYSLTGDELRIYFGQGGAIYTAARASRSSDFANYQIVPAAPVGLQARHPAVSRNGKTLTYALRGGSDEGLVIADLPTPTTVDNQLSLANDSGLSLRAPSPHPTTPLTLLAITGAADAPASGELVLWSSGHVTPLATPTVVASAPVYDVTGERIYVGNSAIVNGSKTRVVSVLKGSGGSTYGAPAPLPSLGTPSAPFPAWISSDHCRLYLWSGDTESGVPYLAMRRSAP